MSLASRLWLGGARPGAAMDANSDLKKSPGADGLGASPGKMGKTETQATRVPGPGEDVSPLGGEDESPCTPGYGHFGGGPESSDGGSSSETCTSPSDRLRASPAARRGRAHAEAIPEEAEANEDDRPPPPGLVEPKNLPSPGSILHGTGGCRPCAWFHKPQGCQNGAECRHCHLCPEGEIKARKKVKVDTMRSDKPEDDEDDEEETQQRPQTLSSLLQEPLKVIPMSSPPGGASPGKSVLDLPPPPGLSIPAAPAGPTLTDLPSAGAWLDGGASGSSVHGSGECKPCAWFYKAQGCQNGKECRHCHACPEGEIRSRRKVKVATLRSKDDDLTPTQSSSRAEQAFWQQAVVAQHQAQEAAMMAAATWEAQAIAAQWEVAQAAVQWEAAQQQAAAAAQAAEDDASPFFQTPQTTMEYLAATAAAAGHFGGACGALPSTGSALHHAGKCRPCAWFWKSQGCLNSQACAHCHLCPEGELKERKRMKEGAMRMGALLPCRPGTPMAGSPVTAGGRSPCVVQIAPLIMGA